MSIRIRKLARVGVILAFVAAGGGCASPRAVVPASNPEAATESRDPASSIDAENLEQTFETLMSSPDPLDRMRGFGTRLLRIYFHAESALRQFDADLDLYAKDPANRLSPIRTPNYLKLRMYWLLSHRERFKIQYFYERLLHQERDPQGAASRNENARRLRLEFENYLFRHSGADGIALHDVMTDVNEVRAAWGLRVRRTPDARKLLELLKTHGEEITARAKSAARGVDPLIETYDARDEGSEADRTPQSDIIAPGAGKSGNMNGGNFPKGTWALTYDDGPSAKHTPQILANLKKNGSKATFFWLARNAALPETRGAIQTAKEEGMGLANHSFTHANLPKQSAKSLYHEITESTQKLGEIYGEKPSFFRCPYGAGLNVPGIRERIAGEGMIHVFWNVDSLDWQDKNPASVLARVRKQMAVEKGGIVLFHDIHAQSVIASDKLLAETRGKVRWVTMQEITDELNGKKRP